MSTPDFSAVLSDRAKNGGLPVGDLRGFGRVGTDASLLQLTFDRAAGSLRTCRKGRSLMRLILEGEANWASAYVPGTNVLESTARTEGGELRVVDFMPLAEARPGHAVVGTAGRFVRIVTCTEGALAFDLVCAVDANAESATQVRTTDGWHLASSRDLVVTDGTVTATVRLSAGESVALVLGEAPMEGGASLVAGALHALGDTIHYWTWWSDRCRYKGDDFDHVLREALGLKLACSSSGLMLECPGAAGYAVAPLGDMSRAASLMLYLGYRQECAELLACVYALGPSSTHDRWSYDECFVATLDAYVLKYGVTQLPELLRDAIEVPLQSLAS